MRMAGDQAILILPAAKEVVRSRDTHYPYRQDSDFSYLTGFPEPDDFVETLVHPPSADVATDYFEQAAAERRER